MIMMISLFYWFRFTLSLCFEAIGRSDCTEYRQHSKKPTAHTSFEQTSTSAECLCDSLSFDIIRVFIWLNNFCREYEQESKVSPGNGSRESEYWPLLTSDRWKTWSVRGGGKSCSFYTDLAPTSIAACLCWYVRKQHLLTVPVTTDQSHRWQV